MADHEKTSTESSPAPQPYNVSSASDSTLVTLLHTERRMRIYGVTENELRTLTIINVAMAGLFAVGSACFGMGLDLHKDLLLAENLPAKARVLENVVQPFLIIAGIIFYVGGVAAFYFRGGLINTIKKETDPKNS